MWCEREIFHMSISYDALYEKFACVNSCSFMFTPPMNITPLKYLSYANNNNTKLKLQFKIG